MNAEINQAVAAELDAAHGKAKDAYCQRNAETYMEVFAGDLSYRQADGTVIGRDQLANDVRAQLLRLCSAETTFVREGLEVAGEEATELLRQTASVTTRHFAVIRRTWNIERLGRYVWLRTKEGWRIRAVDVLKE